MKYLIIGLGNIGDKYFMTRHNIGFAVVDELVKDMGTTFELEKLAFHASFKYKSRSVHVIKPTTYMNESGKAVKYWQTKLGISNLHTLVIADDLTLPFGMLRVKPKGGDGGHNGLKDISASLGTSIYPRLRFGIDKKFLIGHQSDYVLQPFFVEEQKELSRLLHLACEICKCFCFQGITYVMNHYN